MLMESNTRLHELVCHDWSCFLIWNLSSLKEFHQIFELDKKVIFQNQESQGCILGFV
jgi:hypothetical protein